MKRGSALVFIRKVCIKVMLKYYCLSVRLAKSDDNLVLVRI